MFCERGLPATTGLRESGAVGARSPGRAAAWIRLALLALALVPWSAPARAQEEAPAAPAAAPEDDRRYSEDILVRERALSSEIMSPFCPGRTLINCSSDQARAYREAFKRYLASGISEQELQQDFQRRWGDVSRSTPKGALGWALPGVLLALGAGTLFFVLRRFRSAGDDGPSGPPSAASRELEAELDRELKARGL